MYKLFSEYYAPPDASNAGGTPDAALDKSEVIELLGEEEPEEAPLELDTKPKEKKTKEDSEGEEEEEEKIEEPDELEELEQELKGPKEEDLELVTPVRRKEILAKYPTLFKDFPYLEKAYYRDQQFTELLPTIQDAKTAVGKAQSMDYFEKVIMSGDLAPILEAAKHESQEAFHALADGYLNSLRKVDQQTYYHVMGNVIKDTIITMVREGRAMGEAGAPLTSAATILNQFVFGSNQFQPPTTLAKQQRPEDNGRQQELDKREQEIKYNQFTSVRDELQTKADNVLKSTIDNHIDPRGSMSEYVKKNASREAMETLQDLMDRDARFHSLLDKLWEKAASQGFNRESADKIKAAYLSKAKTLLPSVIKKARYDALKGSSKRNGASETEEVEAPTKKGPIQAGKATSPQSGKKKDVPRGMTTLEFLSSD